MKRILASRGRRNRVLWESITCVTTSGEGEKKLSNRQRAAVAPYRRLEPEGAAGIGHVRAADLTRVRDRKSTRLNSSHDQISYAVFCLKKKKNTLTLS